MTNTSASDRSLAARLLSPIAEVRRGEATKTLLLALNLFMVLAAYYMLKTIRESLILTQGGAAIKAYSSAGQAMLLLALVPAFGAFASRVNRIRLVRGVTLFFVSNLALFFVLGRARGGDCRAVLPVGRRFQRHGHRAVLGICQRSQHPRTGKTVCFPSSGWAAAWGRGSDRCTPAT